MSGMKIGRAANWFNETPVFGWSGQHWSDELVRVTYDPYDRFISERPFGLKRRMILVNPETPIPARYRVLRIGATGPVFLRGTPNQDIQADPYSTIELLHMASRFATLVRILKVPDASGVGAVATRSQSQDVWCDLERISFTSLHEDRTLRLSDSVIRFPSDLQVTRGDEALIDGWWWDIQEVYEDCGFVSCRAVPKTGDIPAVGAAATQVRTWASP